MRGGSHQAGATYAAEKPHKQPPLLPASSSIAGFWGPSAHLQRFAERAIYGQSFDLFHTARPALRPKLSIAVSPLVKRLNSAF